MAFLENFEAYMWNEELVNDGLALKVFQDFCCDGCSCKSENYHTKTN